VRGVFPEVTISRIFRLKDGIGQKNQEIEGKVDTLNSPFFLVYRAISAQSLGGAGPASGAELLTRNEEVHFSVANARCENEASET